ncbi:MAG: hypothetical protein GWN30_12275, partial [Gammaproteobacteria bacterium]|nr:hypothetical protein [Gammaproteobacteria bacterium]
MEYHLKTRIAIAVSFLTMIVMLLIVWVANSYFEKEFRDAAVNQITSNLNITAASLSSRVHHALHTLEVISN